MGHLGLTSNSIHFTVDKIVGEPAGPVYRPGVHRVPAMASAEFDCPESVGLIAFTDDHAVANRFELSLTDS